MESLELVFEKCANNPNDVLCDAKIVSLRKDGEDWWPLHTLCIEIVRNSPVRVNGETVRVVSITTEA